MRSNPNRRSKTAFSCFDLPKQPALTGDKDFVEVAVIGRIVGSPFLKIPSFLGMKGPNLLKKRAAKNAG